MGLCKPNRNRRAHLKGPLNSYLNKVVEKENLNPNASQSFHIETLASTFEPVSSENRKKRSCCDTCLPLGSMPSNTLALTIKDLIGAFM